MPNYCGIIDRFTAASKQIATDHITIREIETWKWMDR